MKIWQAGEIISDEKWEALNDVVPRFKKVEWYNENDSILDISKTELDRLLKNDCRVWAITNDGYVEPIRYDGSYSIKPTKDNRIQVTI